MRQWHFGCNLHSWSGLVRTFRLFSIVAVLALVTLCALFSLSAYAASNVRGTSTPREDIATAPSLDNDPSDEAEGSVDLFGNDVTEAVAQYRFDATGSLYEVHSPQTEIPKLGSPKS